MKRFIILSLLLLVTGAWIFFTSFHYKGLNTIQHLANYHSGLLSKEPPSVDSFLVIGDAQVTASVSVDTLGIPHIYGSDKKDLAYAVGFMHARDRYFQMEMVAYAVMGRLSEIIGQEGLRSDEGWRPLELEEKAKGILDTLKRTKPDLFRYLTAYEAGVNAYLAREAAQQQDPIYAIWDRSPKRWKAYYAFLIQWYISSQLTTYDDYFNRQEVMDKLPDSVRQVLYPVHPVNQPAVIPAEYRAPLKNTPGNSMINVFAAGKPNNYVPVPHVRSLGSNNWVVGASLTDSGQLFLCNDLHLLLSSPNVFYEMQLSCKNMHVYGYSIPGVPLIVSGHNEKIAWGITSGEWDVMEQYLLKQKPGDADHYWLNGKWQPVLKKTFNINVKGQAPVAYTAKYTVFGPLVERDSFAYGAMWHPSQSASALLAFWDIMKAADWSDFREALRSYDYPCQNFVYGDVERNIGMVCAGKMPVKPAGYSGGLLDGTISPINRYIPFDSLPQCYNPARDYLFSANQEPGGAGYYFSSRWFDDLYRPQRINQVLSGGKGFKREDMRQMQLDVVDLSVNDLRRLLKKYPTNVSSDGNWDLIAKWDSKLEPYKQEALFYRSFRFAAWIVGTDLARDVDVKASPSLEQLMNFLLNYDSVAVGNKVLYSKDYFNAMVRKTDSLYMITKNGRKESYAFTIPQMTYLPGLDISVSDVGGSDNTINVNYWAHPVIRTLIEINGGTIRSWMVNAIAQTGRINDRHYSQQLPAWKENRLHETQFTADPGKLQYVAETITFSRKKQ